MKKIKQLLLGVALLFSVLSFSQGTCIQPSCYNWKSTDWAQVYAAYLESAGISYTSVPCTNTFVSCYPFRDTDPYNLWVAIKSNTASAGAGWSLLGNATASNNFLGTTNAQDLVFKTNNTERIKLSSSGYNLFTTAGIPSMGEPNEFSWTVNGTHTVTGNNYGLRSTLHYSNTANNNSYRLGALLGVAYSDAANTSTLGWLVGTYGASEQLGQGLITRNVGGYFIGSNRAIGSGSISNNYALYAQTECLDGYTSDNFGVFIPSPLTSTAGTIFNNRGLYIASQDGFGTNQNHAIYQQGATDLSYFEGSVTTNSNLIASKGATVGTVLTATNISGGPALSQSVVISAGTNTASSGTGIAVQLQGGNASTVIALSTLHNGNILWPNNRIWQVIDGGGSNRTLFTYSPSDNLTFNGRPGVTGIFFANGASGTALSIRENNKVIVNGTAPTATFHVVGDMLVTTTSTLTGNTRALAGLSVTTTFSVGGATSLTGALTGAGNISSTSKTAGIGYAVGSGSTVTQVTSRTTGVTINAITGLITLVSAAGSTAWQSFTVTNSAVTAKDVIIVNQESGTDLNMIHVTDVSAGSFRISFATTGGTTVETPILSFAVIKGQTN